MTDSGSDNLRDELAKFIRGSAGYNFALNITEGEAEGIADGLVPLVERRVADAKAEALNEAQKVLESEGWFSPGIEALAVGVASEVPTEKEKGNE